LPTTTRPQHTLGQGVAPCVCFSGSVVALPEDVGGLTALLVLPPRQRKRAAAACLVRTRHSNIEHASRAVCLTRCVLLFSPLSTDSDFATLQRRVAELRDATVAQDRVTASNWRLGRARHRMLATLDDWCRKLCLSPAGDVLIVGTYTGPVHLIDVRSGDIVQTLTGLDGECTALACDGDRIAAGSRTGSVAAWDMRTGAGGRCGAHAGCITAVHLLDGNRGVLAASDSGDLVTLGCTKHSRLAVGCPVLCMQRQGHYTAVGCADGRVLVWAGVAAGGVPEKRLVLSFTAHSAPVVCLQLLPAADTDDTAGGDAAESRTAVLVTGAADGSVSSWDMASGGEPLLNINHAHAATVTCLQADHSKIVTGGGDGAVRCWDAVTGESRFTLQPFTAYLDSVAFNGSVLASTGTNNAVVVHDFGVAAEDERQ